MANDRANDNEGEIELSDEDRLPWLEAVEEDGNDGGPSVGKLVAWVIIGMIAIGVIVGGLYWVGNRNKGGDGNDVIAAEQGDYKQHPENGGGMNLSGEGNVSVAAIEGQQPQGSLNVNNMAEQPVRSGQPGQQAGAPGQPGQPNAAQPNAGQPGQPARPNQPAQGQTPGQPARPAPGQPQQPQRPAPAPSGPAIQLGAFSTPAAANSAWNALAGRFRYLAPLSHSVVPVQAGGRTLHRLRAAGPDSANICRRLQAAGEACTMVQ